MGFLFGKKQTLQSLAETLEDGRQLMNAEMKKPKYNHYAGREMLIEVAVHVQSGNEPASESKMIVILLKAYLLKSGARACQA